MKNPADTIEKPPPKRKKLVGKGTAEATDRVISTSGVTVPRKRKRLVCKGSAFATEREVSTSGVKKYTSKKKPNKPPAGQTEEVEASSSSSGPEPPPPPPVKVGKGKGSKTPKAPDIIAIPTLVTEIKKAIKGDALSEKDIKTANIMSEKIEMDGPTANPNGIKKLRSIYGKSVYKPRAVF